MVAKGPVSLEVCGRSGCTTIASEADQALVFGVLDVESAPFERWVASPPLAPYYELRIGADWQPPGRGLRFFVPAAGVVRTGSSWIRVDAALAASLGDAARGLEPWPAPSLTRVRVRGRLASDPRAYAALFDPLPPAGDALASGGRVGIVLRSDRPTPWTAGQGRIDYYPTSRLLYRDGERFLIPEGLARVIERDGGLLPAAAPSGDFPWAVAGGAAGAFLVAAGSGRPECAWEDSNLRPAA